MNWTIKIQVRSRNREEVFEQLWQELGSRGLTGIHEGTVLSEQAAEEGLETDSWTVDSGEAPRERDWVGGLPQADAELYFDSEKSAHKAWKLLEDRSEIHRVELASFVDRDWDAEWKRSFQGVDLAGEWKILPPWKAAESPDDVVSSNRTLIVNPGAGFGTGTHETTQLCLLALAEVENQIRSQRVLDFGSGSGVLAVGAAKLGAARVDAVEIDPLAIDNATENASLNRVQDQIHFSQSLISKDQAQYAGVIANILKPVLLEFSEQLVSRMQKGAFLILSGLIESDLPAVIACYQSKLGAAPDVRALGEWRALVWKRIT